MNTTAIERTILYYTRVGGENEVSAAARAELEAMKTELEAWKEFAEHQTGCAVCAVRIDDCETGFALWKKADPSVDEQP